MAVTLMDDDIDIFAQNGQIFENGERQFQHTRPKPEFSAVLMCKFPGILVLHRHRGSVTVYGVDM